MKPRAGSDEHREATLPAAISTLVRFLLHLLSRTTAPLLAQFRRNWTYVLSLANLWFRSTINLGTSLRASTKMTGGEVCAAIEEDYATAAAGLYKLMDGYYRTSAGKRMEIDNDV